MLEGKNNTNITEKKKNCEGNQRVLYCVEALPEKDFNILINNNKKRTMDNPNEDDSKVRNLILNKQKKNLVFVYSQILEMKKEKNHNNNNKKKCILHVIIL